MNVQKRFFIPIEMMLKWALPVDNRLSSNYTPCPRHTVCSWLLHSYHSICLVGCTYTFTYNITSSSYIAKGFTAQERKKKTVFFCLFNKSGDRETRVTGGTNFDAYIRILVIWYDYGMVKNVNSNSKNTEQSCRNSLLLQQKIGVPSKFS